MAPTVERNKFCQKNIWPKISRRQKLRNLLKELFQQSDIQKFEKKLKDMFREVGKQHSITTIKKKEFNVRNAKNKDFPFFKKKLNLKQDTTFGRYVTAKEEISVKTELFSLSPFAAVVEFPYTFPFCHTCHSVEGSFMPCEDCKLVRFCSDACQTTNEAHRLVCNTQFELIDDLDVKCTTQMVLETIVTFGMDIDALIEHVEKLHKNGLIDLIPLKCTDKKDRFDIIMGLERDADYECDSVCQAYAAMMQFDNIKELFKDEEPKIFLQHLLAHFMGITIRNSYETPLKFNNKSLGRALIYDFGSFFNHSCSPNVYSMTSGNVITYITSQKIFKNEQFFISYIPDVEFKSFVERSKILNESWGFECKCVRCTAWKTNGIDITAADLNIARNDNYDSMIQYLDGNNIWSGRKGALISKLRYFLEFNQNIDVELIEELEKKEKKRKRNKRRKRFN
ncbi:hypothetical protein HA402_000989 [Bradysia odoriphaga]|nr:hypothetical protein HA402_000989 [Bradysia odoriphaga]